MNTGKRIQMKSDNPIQVKKFSFLSKVIILVVAALCIKYFGTLIGFIGKVFSIAMPFIIGFAIFYVWSLIASPLERVLFKFAGKRANKFNRPLTMVVSLILLVGIFILVIRLVMPQLFESFRVLATSLPSLADELRTWFLNKTEDMAWMAEYRQEIQEANINWQEIIADLSSVVRKNFGGVIGSTFSFVGSVAGVFITAFTAIVFAVYFLAGKEAIGENVNRVLKAYVPQKIRRKIYYVLDVANDTFSSFFKGQVIDAFVVGALLFIAMLIFRFQYALPISVLVMVTALIPMLGAFIGGGIGFIMLASGSIQQGFLFIIVLVVVQQLEGNLIYPKIMSDSIGLSSIWVFAAVIIGGSVGGVIGMLLGVPLAATAYKILRNDVNKKVTQSMRKNLSEEIEEYNNE
ncbi:MAG: AI-2E family transporter [Clostridiales bacterium]|nr:AI-2E family transporter [Clostridiales bacterium]